MFIYSAISAHYERQGDSFFFKKEYEKAKDAYISATEYKPSDRCIFHLARCYQELGDTATARYWFDKVDGGGYVVEAINQLNSCNTSLIEKAAAHITEAEALQDSNNNTILAKLSLADSLLPNIARAESLQQRSYFLRHKIEWQHEKTFMKSNIEQATLIENLEERRKALNKLIKIFNLYIPYFSAEEKKLFDETIELLKEDDIKLQEQNYIKTHKEIVKKIKECSIYLKKGNYEHSAHLLEQATWLYNDINAKDFADHGHIPLEKLESARSKLLDYGRESRARKSTQTPLMISEILNKLFDKIKLPLNKKQLANILESFLDDNWQSLDQNITLEFDDKLVEIISKELDTSRAVYLSCLIFSDAASVRVKNPQLLQEQLKNYLQSYLISHPKKMVELEVFQYLNQQEIPTNENDVEKPVNPENKSNNSLSLS